MELRQRLPRIEDKPYLAWLRKQRCACGCLQGPPCDAAHVRASSLAHGKDYTGGGRKPSDRWALPLKHDHHMSQTWHGDEVGWWAMHGVKDVFALCIDTFTKFCREIGDDPIRRAANGPSQTARENHSRSAGQQRSENQTRSASRGERARHKRCASHVDSENQSSGASRTKRENQKHGASQLRRAHHESRASHRRSEDQKERASQGPRENHTTRAKRKIPSRPFPKRPHTKGRKP